MNARVATFLLGALVGASLALGLRAAILSLDEGSHSAHAGHAMTNEHAGATEPPPSKLVARGFLLDLGNETCPIMGNAVDGRTYSEWNGLRIGHCCPPCVEDLLAAPEKTLDEAGFEWRDAARLVAAVKAASGEERTALLAEAARKYEIVRGPEGEE
jgi:hypothetical protein